MNVNEYMKAHRSGKHNFVKRIVCADGFAMSVQASEYHYCLPREDNAEAYTHVEVGYPSSHDDMPQEYRDGTDSPVYDYVPVEVVEAIVAKHGGLKGD